VTVAAIALASADLLAADAGQRQVEPAAWSLLAVSAAALLVRGRWPAAAAAVTGAACAGWALQGHIGELLNLPVMVVLYALAVQGGRARTLRTALIASLASGAVSLAAGVDGPQPRGAPVLEMLWPLVPLFLGEAVRARRELLREYAERVARAEADREREARRKVREERVRISRELHDVVAHTVSAMTVQAGLALDAFDVEPDIAREAVRRVRASGKEAVRELRAAVGMLREDREDLHREPAPGLRQLGELAERVRQAGLRVSLRLDLGGREPSRLVELAAYRIVQEALTNVLRHAEARHATVSVAFARNRLVVEVRDDGPPAATGPGEGYGLIGIRERAASVGGSADAGPVPGGGWHVRALLPLDGAAA
jgi:signal transduction histidine kinase